MRGRGVDAFGRELRRGAIHLRVSGQCDGGYGRIYGGLRNLLERFYGRIRRWLAIERYIGRRAELDAGNEPGLRGRRACLPMKRLLFIFALICPLQSVGQAWSGLLTSNRAINWQTTPIGDQTGPSPTVYPASWFASLPACATQPSSQTLSALDSAIAADQGAGTQCKIDLTSWGTIAGGGTIGITYAGRANVYLVGTPGQTV